MGTAGEVVHCGAGSFDPKYPYHPCFVWMLLEAHADVLSMGELARVLHAFGLRHHER